MNRNKIIAILTTAFTGAALTAGALAVTAKETDKELFKITIITATSADPYYIADQEGFFEKYGIEVEYTGIVPDSITAVATGAADFAITPAGRITEAISNGFEIKAIAAGWGTSEEYPMVEVLVKEDSDIQSLDDLRGKKIAVPWLNEPYWLEAKEWAELGDDVEEVIVSFDKQEAALATDSVDAIYTLTPYPARLKQQGGYRSIWNALDTLGAEAGWPQQFVNTGFLEEHPDIVAGYVAALADACDFARENPEQAAIDIAAGIGVNDVDPGIYLHEFPEHALIDEENAQLWIDLERKYGLLGSEVTTADIYTNEFNPYYEG